MPGDIEQVTAQLTKLVRAKTGDAGARAHSLESLPGHAGFSYSFILERSTARRDACGQVRRAHRAAGREDLRPRRHRAAGARDGVARRHRTSRCRRSSGTATSPSSSSVPYFVGGFVEGFKLGESTLPLRAPETAGAQRDRDDGRAAQRRMGAATRRLGRAVRAQRGAQAPRLPARSRYARSRQSSRARPNCASACARACRQARASDASMATSNGRTSCSTRNASSR